MSEEKKATANRMFREELDIEMMEKLKNNEGKSKAFQKELKK
jgi:hypothetical protein